MNKLISKIVGAFLGLTMATAVGVGIAAGNKDITPVRADGTYDATMTGGTNGSGAVVIVDSVEKSAIKVGTSSKGGDMTITVGSGATSMSFYAAAWKGVTTLSLNLSGATAGTTSFALSPDDGVTSNSPFTLSGTESSYLFTTTLSGITANTNIKLTSSIGKRFVVWGATYTVGGGSSKTNVPLTSANFSMKVGDTDVAPVVYAGEDVLIDDSDYSFSSSDTSVATIVANKVHAVAVGSSTITITPELEDTSEIHYVSSDFLVTVTETNHIIFADLGLTNETQYTDPFESDDFTIQFGGSANDGKYYNTGSGIRTYKDGGYMTISSKTVGLLLSSVEFVWDGANKPSVYSVDVGAYSTETETWSGSATSFTLTNTNTNSDTWRLQEVIATLVEDTGAQLESIAVSGNLSKTTYATNEEWSAAGLTVTATYDDESSANVTSSVSWTFSPEHPDDTSYTSVTATASYTEKGVTKTASSTAQTVTVTGPKGSEDNPYTVAEAFAAIDAGSGLTGVYTSGIISQIDEVSTQHGNATYWISADGTTSGNQLQAFRGKYLDNVSFTSASQINVGDEVVIYGNLKKYNSTYEYDQGNYLVSITSSQPSITIAKNLVRVLEESSKTVGVEYANLSAAISVSSSDTDVATASFSDNEDGTGTLTVSGVAEGAAVITLTSGETTATLTVDVFTADADNVITFKKYNLNNAQDITTFERSLFTVEFDQSVGSNGPKYYETDATARAYNGNTIEITSLDEQLTQVDFAADAADTLSPDVGSYTTKTWTGKSQSVTFTVSATTKITSITLTFDSGSTDPVVNSVVVSPSTLNLMTTGESSSAALNVVVDAEYGAPETVTWTSSDDDVATVTSSGLVEAQGEGSCVITATSTFDSSKKGTCTVTVVAGDGPNEVTFSKQGYTNGQEVTSFSKTNFSVSFDGGSKYYDTGSAIRVYGGKSFTVTSNLTEKLASVVLEFGSGEGSNAITTDSDTYSSGTWTGSANSVTFSVGGSSGHRRIAKITVTFEAPAEKVNFVSGTVSGNNDFYVEDMGVQQVVFTGPAGKTFCAGAMDFDTNFFLDNIAYDSTTQTFIADFTVYSDVAIADLDVDFYFYADYNCNPATYEEVTKTVQIINPTGLDDARDFAALINDECHAAEKDWETLAELYDLLDAEAQAFLTSAEYTLDGDDVIKADSTHYEIAEAISRYDYMVATYHFTDFMGRASGSNTMNPVTRYNNGITAVVVVFSAISVTTLGGYFLLRKKKEER